MSALSASAAPPAAAARSRAAERLHAALRSPTLISGAAILGFWILCALLGSRITPLDPYADDLLATLAPPSAAHWFGTDQLGRDIFSRVIVGARDILIVAPLATLLGTVLGTALGLAIGYVRGALDDTVSRVIEALQALPLVIVALMALAAVGTSNVTVVLVIGFVFTPLIARTVRSAVLIESELDYVAAARLRGDGTLAVMFIEILPNVLPIAVVEMTVRLGYAIFFVASLSFLGFGIQPPSADWGIAIAENYSLIGSYWWTVLFDAAATASLVVGVNLVADGLESVFET
ncbi:MAG TPA: ABC transporter permease [Steroidobacteraceae bacterium]|nr:ABC transporter permease [Steroidobacteraceae bacterium]